MKREEGIKCDIVIDGTMMIEQKAPERAFAKRSGE